MTYRVVVDGNRVNRYPKTPEVGDCISIGGVETKIKSVVIDCHTGDINCRTEHAAQQSSVNVGNTKAPVMVDADGQTQAKTNKTRNRRKGSRN